MKNMTQKLCASCLKDKGTIQLSCLNNGILLCEECAKVFYPESFKEYKQNER